MGLQSEIRMNKLDVNNLQKKLQCQSQRILPDPLDNGVGRLEGLKIRIVDNLGEVIYTCNNTWNGVAVQNIKYFLPFCG